MSGSGQTSVVILSSLAGYVKKKADGSERSVLETHLQGKETP